MIWQNRKVKIESGNFMISAVGRHDVWNFGDPEPSAAIAVYMNAPTVREIIKIDEERLLLVDAFGYHVLVGIGNPMLNWRIDPLRESISGEVAK